MTEPKNDQQNHRYVLLDSCIFNHLDIPELRDQIMGMLEGAIKIGYITAFSRFTFFELIDTASIENEMNSTDKVADMAGIVAFDVDEEVLNASGHMGSLYKDDNVAKMPEPGDKIIAATSVLKNAVIFTTNGRDFPVPFFRVISTPVLKYNKSGRQVHLTGYFLEPNIPVLETMWGQRFEEGKRLREARSKQIEAQSKPEEKK